METQLLKRAVDEIKTLRRKNELMQARLDMFDAVNAILHTKVAERNQGMSPDLVWEMEKYISSQPKEV